MLILGEQQCADLKTLLEKHSSVLFRDPEDSRCVVDLLVDLTRAEEERHDDTHEWYRVEAHKQARSGELEIDEGAVVSIGSDNGAYVQAWMWVDGPEDDEDSDETFIASNGLKVGAWEKGAEFRVFCIVDGFNLEEMAAMGGADRCVHVLYTSTAEEIDYQVTVMELTGRLSPDQDIPKALQEKILAALCERDEGD